MNAADDGSEPLSSDVDRALAAFDTDELRGIVHQILAELDDRTYARVVGDLIARAALAGSDWTPPGPSADVVAEVIAFVEAAERQGYADPSEIDSRLGLGANAFLARQYVAAFEIFGTILPPITECEIDLGHHEMVNEVLGTDTDRCAAQYVVSVYMIAAPDERARAVRAAIDAMSSVGSFWSSLRKMEDAAVEPLPEFEAFLANWRRLIEEEEDDETDTRGGWDTDRRAWLREVVRRIEGSDGLARIARSTKRADDLQAWCEMLVESRDWEAARRAYEEAIEIVAGEHDERGQFVDGAALAAQELGHGDLPRLLERAWRTDPSMLRLRRWIGSSADRQVVRERAGQALADCPPTAHRQRAFLHVIRGEHTSAAKLLAAAPGLGWSDADHPGHMLFRLFRHLLGAQPWSALPSAPSPLGLDMDMDMDMDIEELMWETADAGEPRLANPSLEEVLVLAADERPVSAATRGSLIRAMREAAERRVLGVTKNKRRGHYGHAASLVAACTALDPTPGTSRWVTQIRAQYRRFSALQREFDAHMEDA